MAIQPIALKSQMIDSILAFIASRRPDADINQTNVLRDLLVEAPIEFFYSNSLLLEFISKLLDYAQLGEVLADNTYRASVAQTLNVDQSYLDQLITSYLVGVASNFSMVPKSGTGSGGYIRMYRFDATGLSGAGKTIPAGTVIQTNTVTPIKFQTTQSITITDSDFDSVNGDYYGLVPIVSQGIGSSTNVSSNVLTVIAPGQAITSTDFLCTNPVYMIGGSDPETSLEFLGRLKVAQSGNFKGTFNGIVGSVKAYTYVSDAFAIDDTSDPLNIGQSVSDISVWTSAPNKTTGVDTVTFNGLNSYIMQSQPCSSLVDVTLPAASGYSIPDLFYSFVKDTSSVQRYSSDADDSLLFAPVDQTLMTITSAASGIRFQVKAYPNATSYISWPGYSAGGAISNRITLYGYVSSTLIPLSSVIYDPTDPTVLVYPTAAPAAIGPFSISLTPLIGEKMSVTYLYNQYINTINNALNSPDVKFLGQDITIREGITTPVYITATVQITPNAVQSTIDGGIRSALATLINSYKFAQEINETSISAAIVGVSGVVDVKIPLTTLSTTNTGSSDLLGAKNELYVLDTLSINYTTARIIN